MSSFALLLAAVTGLPVVGLVGQPAGAEVVLVCGGFRQGNVSGADVALAVYVSVGVSSFALLLAAVTGLPVVGLVGQPAGAEVVLVCGGFRQGNVSGADVALAVYVSVGVSGYVSLLAALTFVPVVGLVGLPLGAEGAVMLRNRNVGGADVALAVYVSISMGGGVGLFAAGAFVPVIVGIRLPLGTIAVGMCCGGGSGGSRSSGGLVAATGAQHSGQGQQHCQAGYDSDQFFHNDVSFLM